MKLSILALVYCNAAKNSHPSGLHPMAFQRTNRQPLASTVRLAAWPGKNIEQFSCWCTSKSGHIDISVSGKNEQCVEKTSKNDPTWNLMDSLYGPFLPSVFHLFFDISWIWLRFAQCQWDPGPNPKELGGGNGNDDWPSGKKTFQKSKHGRWRILAYGPMALAQIEDAKTVGLCWGGVERVLSHWHQCDLVSSHYVLFDHRSHDGDMILQIWMSDDRMIHFWSVPTNLRVSPSPLSVAFQAYLETKRAAFPWGAPLDDRQTNHHLACFETRMRFGCRFHLFYQNNLKRLIRP